MPITLISASLLGLLLVYLSYMVTNVRRRPTHGTAESDGDDLNNAVRAHGNLIEYAPMMLILIGLLEQMQYNFYFVAGLAGTFVVARYMHGLTFGKIDGFNRYRFMGTLLTFLTILVASLAGLFKAYQMMAMPAA